MSDTSSANSAAIDVLLATLKQNPSSWKIRKEMAMLLFEDKRYVEAADTLWNAPEIPSIDIDVAFTLQVLARVKPNRAIRLVHEILHRNHGKPLKNLAVANALNKIGLYMAAARFYGAALAQEPKCFNVAFESQILWMDDSQRLIKEWKNNTQPSKMPLDMPKHKLSGGPLIPEKVAQHTGHPIPPNTDDSAKEPSQDSSSSIQKNKIAKQSPHAPLKSNSPNAKNMEAEKISNIHKPESKKMLSPPAAKAPPAVTDLGTNPNEPLDLAKQVTTRVSISKSSMPGSAPPTLRPPQPKTPNTLTPKSAPKKALEKTNLEKENASSKPQFTFPPAQNKSAKLEQNATMQNQTKPMPPAKKETTPKSGSAPKKGTLNTENTASSAASHLPQPIKTTAAPIRPSSQDKKAKSPISFTPESLTPKDETLQKEITQQAPSQPKSQPSPQPIGTHQLGKIQPSPNFDNTQKNAQLEGTKRETNQAPISRPLLIAGAQQAKKVAASRPPIVTEVKVSDKETKRQPIGDQTYRRETKKITLRASKEHPDSSLIETETLNIVKPQLQISAPSARAKFAPTTESLQTPPKPKFILPPKKEAEKE